MKNKSPFDLFVEESERIRKMPPTDEQIKKINELCREMEKEDLKTAELLQKAGSSCKTKPSDDLSVLIEKFWHL